MALEAWAWPWPVIPTTSPAGGETEDEEGGGGMGIGREVGDTDGCWGGDGEGCAGWLAGGVLRLRLDWLPDLAWRESGFGGKGLGREPPLKLWQWGRSSSWLRESAAEPLLEWEEWAWPRGCG